MIYKTWDSGRAGENRSILEVRGLSSTRVRKEEEVLSSSHSYLLSTRVRKEEEEEDKREGAYICAFRDKDRTRQRKSATCRASRSRAPHATQTPV